MRVESCVLMIHVLMWSVTSSFMNLQVNIDNLMKVYIIQIKCILRWTSPVMVIGCQEIIYL